MKLIILGDVHCGARKDSIAFRDYFTKFYTDILLPYIKKHNIKYIIQLGDFFDSRKNTNVSTLRWAKDTIILPLKELNCKMYIICGNHDIYYRNTIDINSITEHLSQYDHIIPITKPSKIKFGKVSYDLIPWIASENEKEVMSFIKKSKSEVCFGHFEFSGYRMQKEIVSLHGSSIKPFKKYDQIYSGHYHTASSDGHINYVGTPYELTWADCNDEKSFLVMDTLTTITEKVINPYKMYHKIFYSDEHEKLNIKDFDYSLYSDSYIRVIIEHRKNIPHFENFMEALFKNCTPHDISITDTSVSYREIDISEIETQDPLSAILSTVDNDKIETEGIDVPYTKKLIIDIYNEALLLGQEV